MKIQRYTLAEEPCGYELQTSLVETANGDLCKAKDVEKLEDYVKDSIQADRARGSQMIELRDALCRAQNALESLEKKHLVATNIVAAFATLAQLDIPITPRMVLDTMVSAHRLHGIDPEQFLSPDQPSSDNQKTP